MRTPTIDRLSSEGVLLESYYPYGLPAREVLLPELLRRAGYATAAIGKWHLGDCDPRYLPTARGFDSFLGYLAGGESYYNHGGDMRNGTAGLLKRPSPAALDDVAGLWRDTVTVFTTDNGGGGIRGAAWVRGTDSDLAPVPRGGRVDALMHSTDWLPTLCRLAGASTDGTLPLDGVSLCPTLAGVDEWDVVATGAAAVRDVIIHNCPARSAAVEVNGTWDTTTCMTAVDPEQAAPCHAFGITGGAIRKGPWKLLWAGDGHGQSNTPIGMRQLPAQGFHPTNDSVPEPYNGSLYLFRIPDDPTETHNLASSEPAVLRDMLQLRDEYAGRADTSPRGLARAMRGRCLWLVAEAAAAPL
eukprot:gene36636-1210_t